MATYPFRNVLGKAGLEKSAVELVHDLMDSDAKWSHRDTIIRRLGRLPLYHTTDPKGAWLSAYISFQCDLCLANQALRHFGYEIIQGEMENYRLAAIRQEAA